MASKSFRLSQKAIENLVDYARSVTKTNPNRALNILLEALEPNKPQLEHKEGDFFQFPPFLRCQDTDTPTWMPRKECIERCKTCRSKRFCEAWQTPQAPLP